MDMFRKCTVAGGALLVGFAGHTSAAVLSYASSSVINNGNGYDGLGIFGAPGASLVGATYTLTTSFDTDANSYSQDNGYNNNWSVGNAPFDFSLTVNGVTYSGKSFGTTSSEASITNSLSLGLGSNDRISTQEYSYDAGGNFLWISQWINSSTDAFIGLSRDFGMRLLHPSITDDESYDYFSISSPYGITYFNNNSHTSLVAINSLPNQPANVPEPETVALLGIGLLGFTASRRKPAKNNNI